MVGGTAPAVTVQTSSGVTVLFTYLADVGRWQNWCAIFTILLMLSPFHPGCVSLLLAGLHSLTHSHMPYPAFYGICLPWCVGCCRPSYHVCTLPWNEASDGLLVWSLFYAHCRGCLLGFGRPPCDTRGRAIIAGEHNCWKCLPAWALLCWGCDPAIWCQGCAWGNVGE